MAYQISELAQNIGPAVLIDRDMVHVVQVQLRLAQAIFNRLGRKTSPVFDAAKAFFLCGGNQLAVAHDCRRRIRVESVETKNDHRFKRAAVMLAGTAAIINIEKRLDCTGTPDTAIRLLAETLGMPPPGV